ncbi:hypothetical protein [Flavobacterium urocaniciphilum]|uniref:Uncharacterized protein n=1 Tax=Flavobacterium urocaniciphilum TaxID=1299341 RepID=A0A1H9APT2_9FLAO|nr:hypothetical protein [Flavobacterium urocaniciphilum]SEP78565.1 hypothetical protein SAMN05444005_102264 [Flavobacterium urocaniciphilum]
MKNVYVLLFFCCLLSGCTDETMDATTDTTSTAQFASKPEANPVYDNSYKGIYKGVITGDISGALYVNLYNDSQIFAKIITNDNKTFILNNVPITEEEGKNQGITFKKFIFEDDNIKLELMIEVTGNYISILNFSYFGEENYKICLKKETSTSLIKCYTGIFKSDLVHGSVNFTSDGQMKISGTTQELNSFAFTDVVGEITISNPIDDSTSEEFPSKPNPQYIINANLHIGEISGILNRNHAEGNWMINGEKNGLWFGDRLL